MKRLASALLAGILWSILTFPAYSFYPGQKSENSPYVVHFVIGEEFIPSLLLPNGNDLRPQAFKTPYCSGAVVHPHIVITDAHCVYSKDVSPNATIKPGWKVSYPGVEVGSSLEKASEIIEIFHLSLEWYESHDCPSPPINVTPTCSPIGDIAAVVVKDPLPVPSDLRIATIEQVEEMRSNRSEIIGFGYGLTDKIPLDETISRIVNKHPNINYSKIIPSARNGGDVPKKYNGMWPKIVLHTQHNQGESACSGDSGGPFYLKQDGFMYYIGTNAGTNWGMCTEVPVNPQRNLNERAVTWISVLSYHLDVYESALAFVKNELPQVLEAIKLMERQEAEAKAAADLRAKQEAEAKVAADKAAAELKAKQEAEAKAAAELKAKADERAIAESKLLGQYYEDAGGCHLDNLVAVLQANVSGRWTDVAEARGWLRSASCPMNNPVKPWTVYKPNPGEVLRWKIEFPGSVAYTNPFQETTTKYLESLASEKARVEAEKPKPSKKTTITCIKGKLAKKVTEVNPKCPKGYKKK